ncbi:MAG TPA: aspartyl protease family protein [Rhizomicrobium sp.]|jgi:predicted aspartyl protease
MTRPSLAFLFASALTLAACPRAQADEACTLLRIESLDLKTGTDGEVAVPIVLNDRPSEMVIDIGSISTILTEDTVASLGLRQRISPVNATLVNNVEIDKEVKIESVGLGRLHGHGSWPMLVMPDGLVPPTAAGLLGNNFLEKYDAEFDFFHGKLNLFQHHTCSEPVYWTHDPFAVAKMIDRNEGHVTVEAMLDGKRVKVTLDTGSPDSAMSLDAARRLFGWDEKDPRIRRVTTARINGGATAVLYDYPFASLTFDGVTITSPKITLVPQDNFTGERDADILIGMSVLRRLHLYIAYEEGQVYLTSAETSSP